VASIAGIVSQHGRISTDSARQLGRMLKLMRHRGPDNSIVRSLTDDRGALGANEINLSPERTYCTSLEETPLYPLLTGDSLMRGLKGKQTLIYSGNIMKSMRMIVSNI